MPIRVNVDIKQIYKVLCPECKKKVEKIVKERIAEDGAKQVLEGEE